MERGSAKHGPHTDDALKGEVEGLVRGAHATRAEEWHETEPQGEDQPDLDRDPSGTLTGGTPPGMTAHDVEMRSELARSFDEQTFPGGRDDLVATARDRKAPDRVVALLTSLPSNETFHNVQDVWRALGGGVEERRF